MTASAIKRELKRTTSVHARDGQYIELRFAVSDERGGIDFHVDLDLSDGTPPRRGQFGGFCRSGLETHYAKPPEYRIGDAPSHEQCWLTGGSCWQDGTSLWAEEYWLPGFYQSGSEWLWCELEDHHAEVFGAEGESP